MMQKRILLSNGRSPMTLELARNLASRGHTVQIAETTPYHITRFSNAISKNHVVPSPRFAPEEHIATLIDVIKEEEIDLFLPMWEDIFLISKHLKKFPKACTVFASPFALLNKLHHKWLFTKELNKLGIATPETHFITSLEELNALDRSKTFALKACYSRASESVYKIKPETDLPDITPTIEKPWIAQAWLNGNQYCSYSICKEGNLQAHAVYPADFVVQSTSKLIPTIGTYCLTFRPIYHNSILAWVENFAKKSRFTGQIAFDFIELPSGELYAIECNPRMTSGISLFGPEDYLDRAFFEHLHCPLQPAPSQRKQILSGMIAYGWRTAHNCKKIPLYIHHLFAFKDVVFRLSDAKPFFCQPRLWFHYFAESRRFKKRIPSAFTHDLDYNGEEYNENA